MACERPSSSTLPDKLFSCDCAEVVVFARLNPIVREATDAPLCRIDSFDLHQLLSLLQPTGREHDLPPLVDAAFLR